MVATPNFEKIAEKQSLGKRLTTGERSVYRKALPKDNELTNAKNRQLVDNYNRSLNGLTSNDLGSVLNQLTQLRAQFEFTKYKFLVVKTKVDEEEKYWTLSSKFLTEFSNYYNADETPGSDLEDTLKDLQHLEVVIMDVEPDVKINKFFKRFKDMGYMPYTHTLELDLSEFQFYRKDQFEKISVEEQNCFIYAMTRHGFDVKDLVGDFIISNRVPTTKIKDFCNGFRIRLWSLDKNDKVRKNVYGKEGEIYDVGLLKGHAFAIKPTIYTTLYLKHYDVMHTRDDWQEIISYDGKYFRKGEVKKLNSFEVIRLILKLGYVEKIKSSTKEFHKFVHCNDLEPELNCKHDCREVKPYEEKCLMNQKDIPITLFCFADTETITDDGVHKPYCVSFQFYNLKTDTLKDIQHVYGDECVDCFLSMIPMNCHVLFHNAKYDLATFESKLDHINKTEKNGALYRLTGFYMGKWVSFGDSYKMISAPLSKFPGMFDLKGEKEAYPYTWYNHPCNMSIEEVSKTMSSKGKLFIENACRLQKCEASEVFDYKLYAKFYCNRDVEILAQGVTKFWKFLTEKFSTDKKFNAHAYLTISSLADALFKMNGAYDDVYEIGGSTRAWMQQAIVGGRVMPRNNMKQFIKYSVVDGTVSDFICDFDAVSLYPSAIYRLKGFPIGKPVELTRQQLDNLDSLNGCYYVIKAKVTPHKNYGFPLLPTRDDEGNRNFTNESAVVVIDNVTCEDLIEFADATVEPIEGLWFPDGYNSKCTEIIKELYDLRNTLKKEGNPMQNVIKLCMNSAYGKTILKADAHKLIIVEENEWDKFVARHYGTISDWKETKIWDGSTRRVVRVEQPVFKHWNRPHCGGSVLSMSKRIMNEVMCHAENNGLNIYYQDTDSMHISFRDVGKLAKLFQEKYNRRLIGSDMGQFHTDFDYHDKGEPGAVQSILLQKKIYLDVLQGFETTKELSEEDKPHNIGAEYGAPKLKTKNGRFILCGDKEYHVRMKGICNEAIKGKPLPVFEKLFMGHTSNFNLSDNKPMFEYKVDGVRTKMNFSRMVKCHRPLETFLVV